MYRQWPRWKQWAARGGAGLIAIALGAVGSGVWQRLGDPLFVFVRDALLNLGSLGLLSLKDALYADVAQGLQERAAGEILAGFTSMFVVATVALAFFPCYRRLMVRLDRRAWTRRFDDDLIVFATRVRRTSRLALSVIWPILVVLIVFLCFKVTRLQYTARAIGHYEQLLNLVGPYISDEASERFNSRFTQIRSAKDYRALIDDLTRIAQERELILPKFEPW